MMRYLLDAADPTIDILKDLSERDLRGKRRRYTVWTFPGRRAGRQTGYRRRDMALQKN
jgi:hypothetical protein